MKMYFIWVDFRYADIPEKNYFLFSCLFIICFLLVLKQNILKAIWKTRRPQMNTVRREVQRNGKAVVVSMVLICIIRKIIESKKRHLVFDVMKKR